MRKQLLFSTLFIPLVIALSCEKNRPDPECRDASCCYPRFNKYREYIQDVPAQLTGPPQFSSWMFELKTELPSNKRLYKSKSLNICDNSLDKIAGYKADILTPDTTQRQFIYRISGKVFEDTLNPRLTAEPILYLYIDKVEKIN